MPSTDCTSKCRVIIIDDDRLVRDFTVHAIEYGINRKVAAFGSGLKAWQYLQNHPDSVDVVIADANLPEMDGFELLAELKKNHPDMAFILTTSNPQYEQTASRLGADAVVLKPFDIHDIFTLVKKFITATDCKETKNTPFYPLNESRNRSPIERFPVASDEESSR